MLSILINNFYLYDYHNDLVENEVDDNDYDN